jgi:hypothetical protein
MLEKRFAFVVLLIAVSAAATAQQKFDIPIDKTPFATIAEPHDIDNRCPRTGKNDSNTYHYSQNAAKNNLTVRGVPVAIAFKDFSRLQQLTDEQIKNGQIKLKGKYPEDRTQLRRLINIHGHLLGEGSLVTLKAYVFGAHYSNTKYSTYGDGRQGTGEAVNCDNPELDWNDIHIALSETASPTTDECSTVTAEIIPHYRPAIWSRFHDGLNAKVEALLPGLLVHQVVYRESSPHEPLLVKITGPLFYDASHQPCEFTGNDVSKRNSPERRSIWEIHPAYRIQILNPKTQRWVDLARWAK